jgi:hypothetical protein
MREVTMDILDEDPGATLQPLETPPGTPQAYMQTPYSDEIYSVVTLSSEAKSEIFKMKYIGRIVQ